MINLEEKLSAIEARLDYFDEVTTTITANFMALEPSEFKCNVCKQLGTQAFCDQTTCKYNRKD